jgi:hypothetical protein
MVISSKHKANHELLFITLSQRWKDGVPLTDDLLSVRKFELDGDGAKLRDGLIETVIDPDASQLLWSYALRRLYTLEDDPGRRFDLVLHPRLQKEAPAINWDRWANCSDRLSYAASLLSDWDGLTEPIERKLIRKQQLLASKKMLHAFENAPTPCMAATALEWCRCSPAANIDFAEGKDCGEFYTRLHAVLQNLNHPIHKVGPDWQDRVTNRAKDLRDSYTIDPLAPFIEYAVRSEAAFEGILKEDHALPKRTLWGKLPAGRVPADPEYLIVIKRTGGTLDGRFGAVLPGSYGVFFWNDEQKELAFALPFDSKTSVPRRELMRIRSLVLRADSDDLRQDLLQIVLQADASDLLWTYALRQLYLLKKKAEDGFDLLLSQRVQAEAPAERIEYAVAILFGKEIVDPSVYLVYDDGVHYPHGEWGVSCKAKKSAFLRLLENFPNTPSPAMVEVTLGVLADAAALDVQVNDEEWMDIRARIAAADQDPEHPLHKLPAKRKEAADLVVERVLGEPNPFAEQ